MAILIAVAVLAASLAPAQAAHPCRYEPLAALKSWPEEDPEALAALAEAEGTPGGKAACAKALDLEAASYELATSVSPKALAEKLSAAAARVEPFLAELRTQPALGEAFSPVNADVKRCLEIIANARKRAASNDATRKAVAVDGPTAPLDAAAAAQMQGILARYRDLFPTLSPETLAGPRDALASRLDEAFASGAPSLRPAYEELKKILPLAAFPAAAPAVEPPPSEAAPPVWRLDASKIACAAGDDDAALTESARSVSRAVWAAIGQKGTDDFVHPPLPDECGREAGFRCLGRRCAEIKNAGEYRPGANAWLKFLKDQRPAQYARLMDQAVLLSKAPNENDAYSDQWAMDLGKGPVSADEIVARFIYDRFGLATMDQARSALAALRLQRGKERAQDKDSREVVDLVVDWAAELAPTLAGRRLLVVKIPEATFEDRSPDWMADPPSETAPKASAPGRARPAPKRVSAAPARRRKPAPRTQEDAALSFLVSDFRRSLHRCGPSGWCPGHEVQVALPSDCADFNDDAMAYRVLVSRGISYADLARLGVTAKASGFAPAECYDRKKAGRGNELVRVALDDNLWDTATNFALQMKGVQELDAAVSFDPAAKKGEGLEVERLWIPADLEQQMLQGKVEDFEAATTRILMSSLGLVDDEFGQAEYQKQLTAKPGLAALRARLLQLFNDPSRPLNYDSYRNKPGARWPVRLYFNPQDKSDKTEHYALLLRYDQEKLGGEPGRDWRPSASFAEATKAYEERVEARKIGDDLALRRGLCVTNALFCGTLTPVQPGDEDKPLYGLRVALDETTKAVLSIDRGLLGAFQGIAAEPLEGFCKLAGYRCKGLEEVNADLRRARDAPSSYGWFHTWVLQGGTNLATQIAAMYLTGGVSAEATTALRTTSIIGRALVVAKEVDAAGEAALETSRGLNLLEEMSEAALAADKAENELRAAIGDADRTAAALRKFTAADADLAAFERGGMSASRVEKLVAALKAGRLSPRQQAAFTRSLAILRRGSKLATPSRVGETVVTLQMAAQTAGSTVGDFFSKRVDEFCKGSKPGTTRDDCSNAYYRSPDFQADLATARKSAALVFAAQTATLSYLGAAGTPLLEGAEAGFKDIVVAAVVKQVKTAADFTALSGITTAARGLAEGDVSVDQLLGDMKQAIEASLVFGALHLKQGFKPATKADFERLADELKTQLRAQQTAFDETGAVSTGVLGRLDGGPERLVARLVESGRGEVVVELYRPGRLDEKVETLSATQAAERFKPARQAVDRETVLRNADLPRDERIAEALKLGLTKGQAELVARAHDAVPCAVYKCTSAEIKAKVELLRSGGLDKSQTRRILSFGLAGLAEDDAVSQALEAQPLQPLKAKTVDYLATGPLRVTLGGSKVLEIAAIKDLPAEVVAANGLNPGVEFIVYDPASPREFKALRDGEVVQLGRNSSQRFDMPSEVSRTHVRITRRGSRFVIEDLDSSNGTVVSRKPAPRFEIGQSQGPHGDRIAGGKSSGRASNREVIVVDPDEPAFVEFYQKILRDAGLLGRAGSLSGVEKGEVLKNVFAAVKANVLGGAEGVRHSELLSELYKGKEVTLGAAAIVPGKGACRHLGILNAALIERLIGDGFLSGSVFYDRGPGHGWARYRTSGGKEWVLDAMQQDRIVPIAGSSYDFGAGRRIPYAVGVSARKTPFELANDYFDTLSRSGTAPSLASFEDFARTNGLEGGALAAARDEIQSRNQLIAHFSSRSGDVSRDLASALRAGKAVSGRFYRGIDAAELASLKPGFVMKFVAEKKEFVLGQYASPRHPNSLIVEIDGDAVPYEKGRAESEALLYKIRSVKIVDDFRRR